MTDEEVPMRDEIIDAVRQVLAEHAPNADPQDVEESLATLEKCDDEELDMNVAAAIAELCPGEAACNAAIAHYAELLGGGEVRSNPTRPLLEDL